MTGKRKQLVHVAAIAGMSLLASACSVSESNNEHANSNDIKYPDTRTVTQTDDYHGTTVSDPYRWLENTDSEEVAGWVEQQNQLARPYLESLPTREAYKKRMTELWDYEKYDVPFTKGGKFFYSHNNGLQNQYVLWMAESADSEPKVLIDPNTFSEDGTVSMASFELSPEANKIAYFTSDGGTDWKSIHVRDVNTLKDAPEVIEGVKFTNVSWLPDESGFYYSRYPKDSNGNWDDTKSVSIWFYESGTPQRDDKQVVSFDNEPGWNPYPIVINKGKTLMISVWDGYEANAVYTLDLTTPSATPKPLLAKWDALYNFINQHDEELFFYTTKEAPTGRVIALSQSSQALREVIPAQDEALDEISILGGKLFAQYIKDVKSAVSVYSLEGQKLSDIDFDGIGKVEGFSGDKDSTKTYYKLTSFTNPGAIYEYDLSSSETGLYKSISVPVALEDYVTKQVFYKSKDGTDIPMFIVHKRGLKQDGNNKTLLYGYGGFNISLLPGYSVSRMTWVEQGNILAIANLRGGGEYGRDWHKAGTKLQKQNVFDDFIAAGEYLIDQDYTSSDRLAIQGGSNGGLLVGATMTQRPELFSAALPAVGVLDMLRYHTPSANARAWSTDFGLSENADGFAAMYQYSPVHNTQKGVCYPSTLITTGDHDDRVVPWHSYKFAAALQRDQGCDNPVLLRVETRAGHGAGTPTWMRIESYADQWAFLEEALK